MQNIILFDSEPVRSNLLPFTFTRPVAAIRIGILTIFEKWQKFIPHANISYKTQPYLQHKFSLVHTNDNFFINGSICPNIDLVNSILMLEPNNALFDENENLIAARVSNDTDITSTDLRKIYYKGLPYLQINYTYDIFSKNDEAIRADFDLITKGRVSQPIPQGNQVINAENIFIEEGAIINFSILNASTGPIYIGKDAEVMEGCKIRGPFALCEHGGLKMDAKIYGATTIGPYCKAGGEINNSVMFSYSNKGHDGFLGNAVVGEWCNLGADTNNSNLKNTYDEVKLWNYRTGKFEKTGLTFCGLMMADYTKCGINTMFNTGTVVGVGANIFGAGFPRNFIPSFAWGGAQGFETFVLNKFYKTADAMCKRRNIAFTDDDKKIIEYIFNETAKFRFWENN
ncbi:MAG: GlmU family protein [Bacteroidia bacterium]